MANAVRKSGVMVSTTDGKKQYIQLDGQYTFAQIKSKLDAAIQANEFVEVNGELINARLIFRAKPVETTD